MEYIYTAFLIADQGLSNSKWVTTDNVDSMGLYAKSWFYHVKNDIEANDKFFTNPKLILW